jgi:hypothetical protein
MIKILANDKKQLELRRAAERIFKGEMNASKLCVELNADDINDRPISDYAFELIVLFPNDTKKTYPLTFSNKPYRCFIPVDSDLTARAQTLELYVKFTADGVVGRTNTEQLIIYDTPDAEEIQPSGGNVDDFIAGNLQSATCNLNEIPDFAFAGKSALEEVDIPNATYIGKYAFSVASVNSGISGGGSGSGAEPVDPDDDTLAYNNNALRTVNMPNVTNIDKSAFENDANLEITELPDSLAVIGDNAFKDCPKVQLESLPEGLTYIGDEALPPQENFPFDDIPENMIYIGSGFTYEQLTTYINSKISVDNNVLDLSRVPVGWFNATISDAITQGRSLFGDVSQIESIVFPDGITTIGTSAFSGCNALTSLTIPDSVKTIGEYAFSGCNALTSLTIPDSVETIGKYAFASCNALTSLTIPDSVKTISTSVFYGCNALTSLTIPDSVETIGEYAFYDCNALTSLTIPDSVETIDDSTFRGCNALTSLTIPDSVETIGNSAFRDCRTLTSLTIPDSVETIGNSAFGDCNALTSLTIPDSVKTIGTSAFSGCNALTSLTIGNSVVIIGTTAFYDCEALSTLDLTAFDDSNIPIVGERSFYANQRPQEGFHILFKDQATLNAFAAASGWNEYSQYFEVAQAAEP